jgi:YfiH family protein
MDFIAAPWPAPVSVHAWTTLRSFGDMRGEGRSRLKGRVPSEPVWLRQVHGTRVVDADAHPQFPDADAAVARAPGTVCAVLMADCMPVFLAEESGRVVAVAHAGWRGLSGGVIEATIDAMKVRPSSLMAWLGPAIGPQAYEVGEDVRAAFTGYEDLFSATRPGHWLLDLYGVARRRLAKAGVARVHGGGYCTFRDSERFFSYRRDRAAERMAAFVWLA